MINEVKETMKLRTSIFLSMTLYSFILYLYVGTILLLI